MIRVTFQTRDGRTVAAEGTPGQRLLAAAQAADMPLEGTCGGDMACATCHVIVDPAHAHRLPPASGAEEDMLDLTPAATRTSRLSCQIVLDAALDGLVVRIP